MTADALGLIRRLRDEGISLSLAGDHIRVKPSSRLPPELRRALVEFKPALLAVLQPITFVALAGGLTVPEPALRLAWNLEDRGIPLAPDTDHQFIIPTDPRLTPAGQAAIQQWRHHLGAIVEYRAPEV